MRCRVFRAATAVAILSQLPDKAGHVTGKAAYKLSEDEAARIHRRVTRGSGRQKMELAALVRWSERRRRSAQTHPGKRGRG